MIDRATERDIPRLMELLTQVNMVHHRGRPDLFKGPTTKYSESELETLLKDGAKPIFVCRDEAGRALGYAFCVMKEVAGDRLLQDVRTLYIDDLCVDENVRGRGIGRALYEYVLGYARDQGCYNVTLNVWSLNGPAMKFYEKCGLRPQKVGMETIL
ncbi:MAG: GNAT family N-acetyltransferase [Clostridia bacterium]|nr:GNAT family N-acetyltransferase [Clostridia bacterium]